MTAVISTTVLLPMLLTAQPRMTGQQQVAIVWVNTSHDTWQAPLPYDTLRNGFAFWERAVDVQFSTVEYTITVDVDVNALNSCRDWSWTPLTVTQPTLFMVAWEPTYRTILCDGVVVADVSVIGQAIVWGGIRSPELAHTIGHIYAAPHSAGIMDKSGTAVWAAYAENDIRDDTIDAVGARRR